MTYLILTRAGNTSLHSAWLEGARQGHYDLIVSYFGDDPDRYRSPEERRIDYKGGKWDGIHAAFAADPTLLDRYRYIWLPDDDIATDSTTIAEMFRLMEEHDLAVAQPSLTPDSYFSHLIYLQCPSFRLRYVNAVEVMVPCLRSDVLRQMLPLMKETRSGFGLDYIWTRLGADNRYKSAIFDTISVRHTRPIGNVLHREMAKAGLTALDEEAAQLNRLGIDKPFVLSHGGIRASDGRRIDSQALMGLMMARDWRRSYGEMVQTHDWRQQLRRNVRRHIFRKTSLDQIVLPALDPATLDISQE